MDYLQYILLAIEGLVSVLLVLIILIQKTKSGGGLGVAFGGGGGDSLFGSRAGNVLTKGTIILGIAFMVNTMLLAIMFSNKSERLIMEQVGSFPAAAPIAPASPPATTPTPLPAEPASPVEAIPTE